VLQIRHIFGSTLDAMNIVPNAGEQGLLAINIFTVRPENQQALVDCIKDAGDPAGIPGLLSMHLLRSLDGTQVINHMHWQSKDALDAATKDNPVIAATRERVGRLIESAGPNLYEVIDVLP
jgi:heme-degrading monooxygenase HmoA